VSTGRSARCAFVTDTTHTRAPATRQKGKKMEKRNQRPEAEAEKTKKRKKETTQK
jgi:hypothetical protein